MSMSLFKAKWKSPKRINSDMFVLIFIMSSFIASFMALSARVWMFACLRPSLTANLLHDDGVQAIAGAIKFNQGLTSLQ